MHFLHFIQWRLLFPKKWLQAFTLSFGLVSFIFRRLGGYMQPPYQETLEGQTMTTFQANIKTKLMTDLMDPGSEARSHLEKGILAEKVVFDGFINRPPLPQLKSSQLTGRDFNFQGFTG